MKTFCVPSHKSICSTPLVHQGVMLMPEMLQEGIWYPTGGGAASKDNEYWREFNLHRSENEAEYRAALNALMEVLDDTPFIAVVSMRWCSLTYRLVTARRVWLGIYYGNRDVLTYSHVTGHALDKFISFWETPEHDQKVWEARFNEAIVAALRQ